MVNDVCPLSMNYYWFIVIRHRAFAELLDRVIACDFFPCLNEFTSLWCGQSCMKLGLTHRNIWPLRGRGAKSLLRFLSISISCRKLGRGCVGVWELCRLSSWVLAQVGPGACIPGFCRVQERSGAWLGCGLADPCLSSASGIFSFRFSLHLKGLECDGRREAADFFSCVLWISRESVTMNCSWRRRNCSFFNLWTLECKNQKVCCYLRGVFFSWKTVLTESAWRGAAVTFVFSSCAFGFLQRQELLDSKRVSRERG